MATHKRKGNKTTKATNPIRAKLGISGVEAFINKTNMYDPQAVGKMVMLEPREWLDYACIGVAEEASGARRAVYDLNMIEHLYALQYAYDEFKYKTLDKLVVAATPEHFEMADEYVSYNTIRGAAYMGEHAPMFVRSHRSDDWQVAEKWENAWPE